MDKHESKPIENIKKGGRAETSAEEKINLGGFPQIIYLSEKQKIRREYKHNPPKLDMGNISKLNVLNIKNILGVKK